MKIINGKYDFEINDLFDFPWKWKSIRGRKYECLKSNWYFDMNNNV